MKKCEAVIEKEFGFHVVCLVIAAEVLKNALLHAPEWWDSNKDEKHNALFVISTAKPQEIMQTVGEVKPEYEKVANYGPVVFWSAPIITFSRTRYSKIVGTAAYGSVTIRNANTAKKLLIVAEAGS